MKRKLLSGLAVAALFVSPATVMAQTVQEQESNPLVQEQGRDGLPVPEACVDGLQPDGDPCESLSEQLDRTDSVIRPPLGIDPDIQVEAPDPNPNTTPVIPPGALDRDPTGASPTEPVPAP